MSKREGGGGHMQRTRTILAFLSLASIWFAMLSLPPATPAQDLVASEDLVGGSSVFVFKEGKKKPQQHAASARAHRNLEAQSSRGRHVSAAAATSAQKRRLAEVAARKKVVRPADRRETL